MKKKQLLPLALCALLFTAVGCSGGNKAKEDTGTPSAVKSEAETTAEKNLAVALKFVNEGLNKGNMSAFDECVDTAVVVYTGLKPSGPINGINEYKSIFASFLKAWPQVDFTIDESFAVGDKVVIRFNSVNAFKGEYYGMKPTNQIASLKEAHIMTLKNGKIVNNIVSATNLEYEYILYPILKDGVMAFVKQGN